jgi:hypothetical protein
MMIVLLRTAYIPELFLLLAGIDAGPYRNVDGIESVNDRDVLGLC